MSPDFIIILAACLIASSSLLIHKGLTPASTSSASKPAVPGILKHITSPFLCIFSKKQLSPTCQTAAAYSNCGVIRALYKKPTDSDYSLSSIVEEFLVYQVVGAFYSISFRGCYHIAIQNDRNSMAYK